MVLVQTTFYSFCGCFFYHSSGMFDCIGFEVRACLLEGGVVSLTAYVHCRDCNTEKPPESHKCSPATCRNRWTKTEICVVITAFTGIFVFLFILEGSRTFWMY